jgi:hypothetical protein
MSRKKIDIHERLLSALEGRARGLPTGVLANYVRLSLQDPAFHMALEYLVLSGLVVVEKQPWGRSERARVRS